MQVHVDHHGQPVGVMTHSATGSGAAQPHVTLTASNHNAAGAAVHVGPASSSLAVGPGGDMAAGTATGPGAARPGAAGPGAAGAAAGVGAGLGASTTGVEAGASGRAGGSSTPFMGYMADPAAAVAAGAAVAVASLPSMPPMPPLAANPMYGSNTAAAVGGVA